MDKLVLEVHKSSVIKSNIVRLPDEAIRTIQVIQLETGLSASFIVSQMIQFAKDKIEIKEV
ncbi:hypothetical protein [Anaerotruncus rubiinfantis]|uniref:hypothetical protein n=1 Tax=Anaerotruncus rubiinfantis TaxID=1720200 RepID=UPI003D78F8D0